MRLLQSFLLILLLVTPNAAAMAERRAVVVGISTYKDPSVPHLINSLTDADLVADKLRKTGFRVETLRDDQATTGAFAGFWATFMSSLNKGDEVVFYFSGHGLSENGANYLALQDMPFPTEAVPFSKIRTTLVNVSRIAQDLKDAEVKIGIIILEACRENFVDPTTHALIGSGGLAVRLESQGTIVWYAASNGEVAKDSDTARSAPKGSTFTRVLVDNFDKYENTDIERYAKEIRRSVTAAAQPIEQHSEMASNYFDDWCFGKCPATSLSALVQVYSVDAAAFNIKAGVIVSNSKYEDFLGVNNIEGNAVFLGKKSKANGCLGKVGDGFPFGCNMLHKIIDAENNGSLLRLPEIQVPIIANTATNVRRTLPKVNADGFGVYACVVKTLEEGDAVKIDHVVSLTYDGDTFYWGVTAGKLGDTCSG